MKNPRSTIRITGGLLKGRGIEVGLRRDGFRPAQSRVREAIFSMLNSEDRIESARVLDLFSGAGTLGIEALSRGAASALFVEQDRDLARDLKNNLNRFGLNGKYAVLAEDVSRFDVQEILTIGGGAFDLIFIDPPYKMVDTEVESIIERFIAKGVLAKNGLLILGRDKRSNLDVSKLGGLAEKSRKVYGDSAISYYYLHE